MNQAHQTSLSITNSWSPPKPMSIESVIPSNRLNFCCPFSSHLQSFPSSGSFQKSQLFASCGQSIGVSDSTSVLPMNIHDWSLLGWTGWISLQCKGLSTVYNTTVQKHQFLALSFLYGPILISIHDYQKNIVLTRWTILNKVMSLLFNKLSSLVITFLPRSECLFISWLQHHLQWFWSLRK